MEKEKHFVVKRIVEDIGGDCYGYEAICSCGKSYTGFSGKETENKIQKHIKSN